MRACIHTPAPPRWGWLSGRQRERIVLRVEIDLLEGRELAKEKYLSSIFSPCACQVGMMWNYCLLANDRCPFFAIVVMIFMLVRSGHARKKNLPLDFAKITMACLQSLKSRWSSKSFLLCSSLQLDLFWCTAANYFLFFRIKIQKYLRRIILLPWENGACCNFEIGRNFCPISFAAGPSPKKQKLWIQFFNKNYPTEYIAIFHTIIFIVQTSLDLFSKLSEKHFFKNFQKTILW